MIKRVLAPVLAAACTLGVASCIPAPNPGSDPDPGAEAAGIDPHSTTSPGFPLPDGSSLESPGEHPPEDDSGQLEGTLRPAEQGHSQDLAQAIPLIMQRGRLIVGIDQSSNRMSFRDPVTGQLSGFEVDLAQEIAKDIFGDPRAVEYRFIPSADRTGALNRREVDIVAQTLSITPDREEVIQFSAPYLSAHSRLLTLRDSGINSFDALSGRTVCAVSSSTPLQTVRRVAPNSTILKVKTWSDCLMAIQQRQADAIIADDAILAGIADQDPFTVISSDVTGSENYGLGIRRTTLDDDADGLVRQVNYTLERIHRDGTWDRLYRQWFGDSPVDDVMPSPTYRQEEGTP